MLFGLALLAGLVGYAVVVPAGDEADETNSDGMDTGEADIETGGGVEDELDAKTVSDTPEVPPSDTDTPDTDTPDTDTPDTDTPDTDTPDPVTADPDMIINGTQNDDLIYGGDGEHAIYGGDGDDQLHGGDGSNTINGDAGNDTLFAGDGVANQSLNTLNGGAGEDTIYGSNEAENHLNGGDGDDQIHMRGHDTATGGEGLDSFHYSTEYGNGEMSTIADYNADEDQIVVEHSAGFTSGGELAQPVVTIDFDGDNAVICLDGEECVTVQGAASTLAVSDILLRANPSF